MPLIMITGYPCSGKTTRALQLRDYFIQKIAAAQAAQKSGLSEPSTPYPEGDQGNGEPPLPISDPAELARIAMLKVQLITVDSLGIDREAYRDARSEKEARATEYSAVKRFLSKDDILIADSLNYIKGYRYQLYCEAKAVLTPSCVVHIGTPVDLCRRWNNERRERNAAGNTPAYADDILENLIFRYEEPNGMNRWDSPLFTVPYMDEAPDYDAIWDAIMGKGVVKPAAESNYLYELDKTTQEIVSLILDAQKNGIVGGEIKVPNSSEVIELPPSTVTLPQLQRIRRQYISLNRQHTQAKSRIKELFVNYLNQNLN
ncbi:chromatin associated protein KTI12 [Kalaharituber pfeilii]|nr:chromatin associated protein KTI12 [Kalaharituber pfeilii]